MDGASPKLQEKVQQMRICRAPLVVRGSGENLAPSELCKEVTVPHPQRRARAGKPSDCAEGKGAGTDPAGLRAQGLRITFRVQGDQKAQTPK